MSPGAFSYLFACGITDLSGWRAIIVPGGDCHSLIPHIVGKWRFGYVPCSCAAVLVGVALDLAVNMTLFQVTKIPPWIAGLGMTMVYETIAGYTHRYGISGPAVEGLADEMRCSARSPAIYIMLVIGFIIAYVTYNKDLHRSQCPAVGGNADVAQMMGINTRRSLCWAD